MRCVAIDVIAEAPDVPILIKSTINEGWKLINDTKSKKKHAFHRIQELTHWRKDATTKKDFYFGGNNVNF